MKMLKGLVKKQNLPTLSLVFIFIVFSGTVMFYQRWKVREGKPRQVIQWDIISYYAYLPATFNYGDVTLGFLDDNVVKNDNKFWYIDMEETGKRLILTSMGLSFLYAPFYFMANALAPLVGQAQDGYSSIYELFLIFSGFFYAFLGLIMLAKFLRKYFDPVITAITVVAIGLGTNLYYYSAVEPAMPHGHNFFLIMLFITLVIRWYEKPKGVNAALLGFVFGLITLVRPTNILVFLFLLLYGVTSWKSFVERITFYIQKWHLVVLMLFLFLIPWIPQFLYWKEVTGHYMYFTYGEKNASFDFLRPHIWEGLFSFRKGWLIYTPMMIIALAGIPLLYKRYRTWFYALAIYMVFMIYVQSSWWCWWFGGGFGLRTYISAYPFLAFPLALVLDELRRKKMQLFIAGTGIVLLLTAYQVLQTRQFTTKAMHWCGMTFESYMDSFLRRKPTAEYWKKLDMPDYSLARLGIYLAYPTKDDGDHWQEMSREEANKIFLERIESDKKVIRQIERYAREENIDVDSAKTIVTDRMYVWRTR